MDLVKLVEEQLLEAKDFPRFKAGDNVSVSYRIIEGSKERIQVYKGDVIQIKGEGRRKTFTVRKMSGSIGVERIFPICSPNIVDVVINKVGKVRRAKLYYLRELIGKKAKIKEKKIQRG